MKKFYLMLICFLSIGAMAQNVTITKIIETNCGNPFVKTVELYVDGTVDFSSQVTLNYMQNGDPWADNQIDISGLGTITDSFVYIVRDIPLMETEFPNTTFDSSNTVVVGTSTNGNDGYQIVLNGVVVSQFGETQTDGSSEAWEHGDTVATRKDGVPDNGNFDINDWNIEPGDSLDSETACQGGNGLEAHFATLGSTFPLGSGSGWTPACETLIGADSVSCNSESVGLNDDTYDATLDFTGANNGNTFMVSSTAGTVGGDDPSSVENGTITITNIPEGTDITVTVSDTNDGGVCDLSRDIASPGCIPLVLNETLFDPPGGSAGDANGDGTRDAIDDEFVELYNDSCSNLDISGYTISDSSQERHVFPTPTIIPPNGIVVVFGGGTPTGDFGGAIVQTASTGSMVLNNGGDSVIVENSSGTPVIEFNSNDFTLDFGDNQSITRNPDITGNYDLHTNANASLDYSPGTAVDGTAITNIMTWIGAVDTDWNNAGNWDTSSVLTDAAAIIPDVANQPVINETDAIQIKILSLENNASLMVEGDLNVDKCINNNGNITFKSNSSTTAQIDEFNGEITGSGDVTVERYIPVQTEGTRAFRFLTSSVDSTNPIFNNWQESGNSPAGFGTHITGSTSGANGFDQSVSGLPSMYTFDNSFTGNQDNAWNPIPNTDNTNLVAGEAYRIFIRGDRNYDLDSDPANAPNSDVTLRATGSMASGNQTTTLSSVQDYYSLVGNPYQANVNINDVNSTNMNTNFYWVWDPNMSTQGAYVAVDLSTGNSQTPGGNASSSDADQFVMPGQSFFVQTVNNGAADITFTEASKDVTATSTAVFSDNNLSSLNLKLYKTDDLNNQEFESDALQINFDNQFDNTVNIEDADKLMNPDENLARNENNELVSIEKRNLPTDGESLSLYTDGFMANNYTFVINSNNLPDDVDAYLVDNHTGNQTLLNDGENQISFMIDESTPASVATDRFSLDFEIETFGVNDNELADNFKVYPNPVTDGQVSIQSANMTGEATVSLYNMIGQRVFKTQSSFEANGKMDVNLGNPQSGVYFIEIDQNGEKAKERLIIK